MYRIFWRYLVKPDRIDAFERVYGPEGDWAQFFRRGNGYLGTQLFREIGPGRRYVTIDEWDSESEYQGFRASHLEEYEAIDRVCEDYTEVEEQLGTQIL